MEESDRVRASIALRSIPGVGDGIFRKLFERFGSVESVFAAGLEGLRAAGVPEALARTIAGFHDWTEADLSIRRAREAGADVVLYGDSGYPTALRHVFDPPPILYVRGQVVPTDAIAAAIVGSRNASAYGLTVAHGIARDLARAGVSVVSGLAIGIDAAAHRGALEGGGRTIAVLGSGIDRIYPPRHRRLAAEIAERGALLSEFPPGTEPERGNFPRRNRIVSGLALAAVVVEAGERSGSLITARLAAEQGREVFAVPGLVQTPRTRGTHALLRDGAGLVESGADVIAGAMPWLLEREAKTGQTGPSPVRPEGDAARMLDCFEETVVSVDELIRRTRFAPGRALEILLDLELRGLVVRHAGMAFARVR